MPDRGPAYPLCRPVGDRHLTVELGNGADPRDNELVHLTDRLLTATAPPGLLETTPTHASLLVRFDPATTGPEAMARVCLEAARAARLGPVTALETDEPAVVIPVVYGGEWGPDLGEVTRHTGLAPDEVASRHERGSYRVLMIGFAPGFPYLGGMDPSLATPRLDRPRARVPAGSVGIAGSQTGIYPHDLPGGWRIIGRTPLRLWRPEETVPYLLGPGRRVRFVDCGRGREGWAKAVRMAGEPPPPAPAPAPGMVSGSTVAVVRRPGPLTTVQDGGRWGYARWGVPESGALDRPSLHRANLAAGNEPGAAALEITYGGLVLEFTAGAVVALSAGAGAVLDGEVVPEETAVEAGEGAMLEVRGGDRPRSYLALRGGVACPVVLGSRSTYIAAALGGLAGRALRSGDEIRVEEKGTSGGVTGTLDRSDPGGAPGRGEGGRRVEVRAVPGPQVHAFEPVALASFFTAFWRVTAAGDRRACVLDGTPLAAPPGTGLSDGTPAGSVQVLPSGLPVVLMADHQPTGGYAKIAVVIEPDLPLLAQAWPGDLVRFIPVGAVPAGVVLRLNLAGRSHLVSVESTPPRYGT